MNEVRSEVRALARSLATHLRFLRDRRGVHYVSAALLPIAERPPAAAAEGAPEQRGEVPEPARVVPAKPPARPEGEAHREARKRRRRAPIQAPKPPPASAVPVRASRSGLAAKSRTGTQPKATKEEVGAWSAARKLEYLRVHNVGDCQRCALSQRRRTIVFGVGSPDADLMFIGEAPGADEDREGIPFVGRAGQRLTQLLQELGLTRDEVYIANVIKCRPPGNRDPQPREVEACAKFLHAQIRAIQPRVIVALGRHAAHTLIGRDDLSMRNMRGRAWKYRQAKSGVEVPLVVTYHPSYVLRRESEERRQQGRGSGAPSQAQESVLADLRQAIGILRTHARPVERDS